jgi:ubiquinone biosynthesis monooxygenase Coq7
VKGAVGAAVRRYLKVDHAGEYGAIRIYGAQIALARFTCPELLPFLRETLQHEQDHLARFAALMPARGARPCGALVIWGLGGTVLGAATGLLGRRAVLVCTEAVEQAVHRHLDEQLRHVGAADPEFATVVADIQAEELGHLAYASRHRGGPGSLARLIHAAVTVVTEALIWAATLGSGRRTTVARVGVTVAASRQGRFA